MFKLKINKNQKINEIIVQLLFYSFPVWFIVGNLTVSLNTLLLIIFGLILIKKNKLSFRFDSSYWIVIVFFSYFFLSSTIQFLHPELPAYRNIDALLTGSNQKIQSWDFEDSPIVKSFLLFRFPILLLVIDTLFYNKILNLKKLFLCSLVCTSFVSLDIIFQYSTGTDIFGFKGLEQWNPGPFGDEVIAGTYLKNFSLFSFFYFFYLLKDNAFKTPLLILVIAIHLIGASLAGNRMPMFLFLFSCFLIIFFIRNFRFSFTIGLLIFFPVLYLMAENDTYLKNSYQKFFYNVNVLKIFNKDKLDLEKKVEEDMVSNQDETPSKNIVLLRGSGYNRIFRTSLIMWKEQPLTGFGFKSFRIKCWEILKKDNLKYGKKSQDIACANHSHNYYLEILSEAGLVGISLLVFFFLILIKRSSIYLKKYIIEKNDNLILTIPIIISLFIEIWPIKSTGSFFTTWGATYFWITVALLISEKNRYFNQKF